MLQAIKDQLEMLRQEKQITILLAVESGSRAWGVPSPDSDYDVRIMYLHQPDWYLSISDRKEFIDYFHGQLLDINGWELRKVLRLLSKSNVTPFEWAQSPMVYEEVPGFKAELMALAQAYFKPRHSFNHYKGIAQNSYHNGLQNGQIKLKTLFYVIRPILAASWISRKGTIPPMDMQNLLPMIEQPEVLEKIKTLIEEKASADESFVYELDPLIKTFIEEQLATMKEVQLPNAKSGQNYEPLNQFFRKLLTQFYP